jgi:tetratricopeptide (TPR) repeat protein
MSWDLGQDPADAALASQLLLPLDGKVGPARRLSQLQAAQLAAAVVQRALAPLPARRAKAPRRLTLAAAAVALLFFSLGAAAAGLLVRYVVLPRLAAPPAPAPRGKAALWPLPPVPEPAIPEELEAQPEPGQQSALPSLTPSVPSAPRERAIARVVRPLPEDLLAQANDQRRVRNWADADRLYRAVAQRYPGSDAAVVAEIASGTLHLEHLGDPDGAFSAWSRALSLRPAGPLAEEARWGLAEAQRARGDKAAERAALGEFLARHPESVLAPAARRRKAELAP